MPNALPSTIHPLADPKPRFTLGLHKLHHTKIALQNWGFYFLDPPGDLDSHTLATPKHNSNKAGLRDNRSLFGTCFRWRVVWVRAIFGSMGAARLELPFRLLHLTCKRSGESIIITPECSVTHTSDKILVKPLLDYTSSAQNCLYQAYSTYTVPFWVAGNQLKLSYHNSYTISFAN